MMIEELIDDSSDTVVIGDDPVSDSTRLPEAWLLEALPSEGIEARSSEVRSSECVDQLLEDGI